MYQGNSSKMLCINKIGDPEKSDVSLPDGLE